MRVSGLVVALACALGVSAQSDNLSEVDGYSAASCRNYVETWVTKAGSSVTEDGQCFSFPANGYPSVKVYALASNRGCSVTLYTDTDCTNRPTSAKLNTCVSGGPWKSFSTDGCRRS